MNSEESLIIELVRKKLMLKKPKEKKKRRGIFGFKDKDSNMNILFEWDGYAISKVSNHEYVIEIELCEPHTSHIQNHITRFLIMKKKYNKDIKIIFVIKKYHIKKIKNIIIPWYGVICQLMNIKNNINEDIIYVTKDGEEIKRTDFF